MWRDLDPAERYFWLFDRLDPMNFVVIAELDRHIDVSGLGTALAEAQARHPLLRARLAVDDGRVAFAPTDAPLRMRVDTTTSSWRAAVADEFDDPLPLAEGPAARARYLPLPHGRSVVLLTLHHVIADGLAGVRLLQRILRRLEGSDTLGPSEPVPPALHERIPQSLRSARATLDVVAAVRAERQDLASPHDFPAYSRASGGRRSRFDRIALAPAAVTELRARARAEGATVHGALAAAALQVTAEVFSAGFPSVVPLASPIDLRRRSEPPIDDEAVVVAMGLLCTPYPVTADDHGALARRVTEQTHREVGRGESHLFYRFARAASFAADDDGFAAFAAMVEGAPKNLAVSNLGVVDAGGDPSWVHAVSPTLSPSPNQLAFVAATTYGDRLLLNVATDRSKLDDAAAASFLDRLAAAVGGEVEGG